MDLWGPYRHKTHNNCNMFLTIVEDKSKTTWIFLLSDKSMVSSNIKNFMTYVENQFNTSIKVIRSNNGSEFLNKDLQAWLSVKGVVHQTACVYTPQQNGLVERKHRSLLNISRALRFKSFVPIHYWGYCLLTAAYLLKNSYFFNWTFTL